MERINIIAILLSPIIAVIISVFISNWMIERRNNYVLKSQLLRAIIGRRANLKDPEFLSALNSIRIVFHNDKEMVADCRNFYDSLRTHKEDTKLRNQEFTNLVLSMCESLKIKDLKESDIIDVST